MTNRASGEFEWMPGSLPQRTMGATDFAIILTEQDETATDQGRRALLDRGIARNVAFQSTLRAFLESRGLSGEVESIGDPTVFPIVGIRCTPEIAAIIRTMPGVDDVIRDIEGFAISSAAGRAAHSRR